MGRKTFAAPRFLCFKGHRLILGPGDIYSVRVYIYVCISVSLSLSLSVSASVFQPLRRKVQPLSEGANEKANNIFEIRQLA